MKIRSRFCIASILGPIVFGWTALRAQADYEIKSGDTLSSIAMSKYGALDKWKALYDLNKDLIKDPHWIYPGQRLRLLTDDTLVAANGIIPVPVRKQSQEWRLLPLQNWERFTFKQDPYIDPNGFDRRSTIGKRFSDRTLAPMAITPDRIAILGAINGSRSNFSQIGLGEQVFIRADESIQVGTTYSITTGPEKTSSSRDGRVGFIYGILGKVKIIGVRDGLFIGTITSAYSPIERENLLIPEVQPLVFPKILPCVTPVNASILVPKSSATDLIGQQRLVFLDVGTNEGVKPGMIFRHYLHRDPFTKDKLSSRDFMIESELQVLSSQEQFSIAIVLHSRSGVHNEDEVVGLTDLRDFNKNQGLQSVLQEHAADAGMDELDRLDTTEGVGEKEYRELRQLETWSKQSPSEGTGNQAEIKREVLNPAKESAPEIGEESAPNDQSNQPVTPPPPTVSEPPAPP
ncbi:MAG: LysM peptidoglycan-binding domain-containing protein, partial [Proteobacteria bacterium]|nr:LysM peptidoglycan-binding domain-containing protein [Pseudomonadota bacterium]